MTQYQRPDIHTYYMMIAKLAASRGTCLRSKVGCVLTDERDRVLSIGYNGSPASMPHCISQPCSGAKMSSGTGLDKCEALHAEQSALVACRDIHAIKTAYVTRSPCVFCMRMLLNTSCDTIYYGEEYPHENAIQMWKDAGRKIRRWSIDKNSYITAYAVATVS